MKAKTIEEKDDFKDLLKHSERVASKLWDNKEDEIWNDCLKELKKNF